MLNIHDLLEDPKYKEFICQKPAIPPHLTGGDQKPWRLYALLKSDHTWRVRRFATYSEAFKYLKRVLPLASDATINCGAFTSPPPTRVVRIKGKYMLDSNNIKRQVTKEVAWKPVMPMGEFQEHIWCPYCRRPTVFDFFSKHHALTPRRTAGIPIDPTVLRCSICGASERIINMRIR